MGDEKAMKIYSFGEKTKPAILLLPGTCCHWKRNFGHVIPLLQEHFYVLCASYDGFDETEDSTFPNMLIETAKLENYIQKNLGGQLFAAYGCSLGGSFVGLMVQRKKIHIRHGILGSSDLDQGSSFGTWAMAKAMTPLLGKMLRSGKLLVWAKKKMEEKAAKKAAKKAKKNHEADKPDAEIDDSDSVSSKIVMVLVTILIIAIWLGIFAVFVKADVGGCGSTVLAPALKDVPVLSKILPDSGNITASESKETAGYTNLDDAVSRIKELEKQLDDANSKNQADAQTINDLNAQIQDLSTYKEDQAAFEEEKEKYYEEVVFSDKAPDIKEYKKFYEQVDPANAEILYKQVCEQLEQDDEIKDYAQTYSKMKPKEAAAIFDSMTDNLSLVAKILNAMDAQSRGNILGKMDSATAAKVTKIMNPSQN